MPYRGIPYAVLDARYLRLDCTNDPLTAGLEINAATLIEPVLTLQTTDDNVTNPILEAQSSAGAMLSELQAVGNLNFNLTVPVNPGLIEINDVRFMHLYGDGGLADENLFIGRFCGNFTMAGATQNIGVGYQVLENLTSGDDNVGIGYRSLRANTSGSGNFALRGLASNTTGRQNVAIGAGALGSNTTGRELVGIGHSALTQSVNARGSVGIGHSALYTSTGDAVVGIGRAALYQNAGADYSVGVGDYVLSRNLANSQVGIGHEAGRYHTTGVGNVYVGYQAGRGVADHAQEYCVFVGYQAGYNEATDNKLYIANTNTATPLIYGEFDTWRLGFGNQYAVDKYGELAHASGFFAAVGDAQASPDSFICRRAVASHVINTWYALYPDGGTTPERLTIAADSVWMVDVLVIGLTQNAAQQWAYQIVGVLERDNANNTTLAVQTVTTHFESDATYDAQLVADDANEALEVQVRRIAGGADYDVRWCCTIRHCQVGYP